MNETYPEYKESGIEWLGEVPEHWSLRKLKYAVTLTKQDAEERHEDFQIALENIESWTGQFIETDSDYSVSGDAFEEGDILFNKLRPYLAKVYHAQRAGTPVGELLVFRPEPDVSSRFLFYRLLSAEFIDVVDGSTYGAKMPRASWDFIGDLQIPIPPVEEQRTIAAYLDRKTAQIDTLIAKKQRLIDLLQEQRTAVINRAVTQGLDPDAPMQDSGIEWLGEVPAHWDVLALKRVVDKFIDYRGRTPTKTDEGVLLITAKNIEEGYINLEESQEFISPEDYDEWMTRGLPEKGDVLVTTEAPLGKVAQVEDEKIALAQRIILLRVFKDKIRNDYLKYYLLSVAGQSELLSRATGSTARGIKASKLKEIAVSVPPLEEQDRIIRRLDTAWNEINEVIQREQDLVERLKELRTSFISEVVTGKIDVRDKVPVQAEVAA
jgi:type I restriction enzyme S subunit